MRSRVVRALRRLDAVPVENVVYPGTPDVEFMGGWVELKSLDKWPVRDNTPVAIEHFTPQQRRWLQRRCLRGGKAWLLLRVGKEWLLMFGLVAADIVGNATRAELCKAATRVWCRTPSDEELLEAFQATRENDQ